MKPNLTASPVKLYSERTLFDFEPRRWNSDADTKVYLQQGITVDHVNGLSSYTF